MTKQYLFFFICYNYITALTVLDHSTLTMAYLQKVVS